MSNAGPPTPFRFSTVAGVPGPPGAPGAPGAAGAPGTNGNPGTNAFTNTTASFSMPAAGGTVPAVPVGNTAWIAIGALYFIETAGLMKVTAKGGSTVDLQNPSPAPAGNAAGGTTIASGKLMTAGGAAGTPGPAGPAPPGIGPLVNQSSGVPIALSANEGQAAIIAGGIPAAAGVMQALNVKSYGAVGDGVHDDLAAINAAVADAISKNKRLYFPSGTYSVSGEILVSGFVTMEGDRTDFFRNTAIQATSPMRSVMCVNNGCVHARGLSFDANRLATYAVLHMSAAFSEYESCAFLNALSCGDSLVGQQKAVVLSSVTQTGPGPALNISSPDPTFNPTVNVSVVVKIDSLVGGVPQIKVSFDGGSTYSATTQPLVNGAHLNQLGTGTIAGFPIYGIDTGTVLGTNAGVYVVNTTYAFTITHQSGEHCVNDSLMYKNCTWENNGFTYTTTGIAANYAGEANVVTAPGTVTTQINDQLVVGAGTNWLSLGLREGDGLVLNGKTLMILAVLDDTHLVTLQFPDTPVDNLAGADFAIGRGAGHFEQIASDNSNTHVINGLSRSNPVAMRYGGPFGLMESNLQIDGQTVIARAVGGWVNQSINRSLFLSPYTEDSPPGSAAFFLASPVIECTIQEAIITTTPEVAGNGSYRIMAEGTMTGRAGNSLPVECLGFNGTQVNITSGTTLTPPDNRIESRQASYYIIRASSDIVWSNPINPGNRLGDMAILDNYSGFDIILPDRAVGGTLALPVPFVNLSYLESVTIRWNGVVWAFVGKSKNYQINGSSHFFNKIVTADASAHVLYKWSKNHGWTAGFAAKCNVIASESGTNGSNQGQWLGLRLVWDGSGNNLISGAAGYVTELITGTNSGAPPFGWNLTVTNDANFVYLNAVGDGAHTVVWKCYNDETLSGAYS